MNRQLGLSLILLAIALLTAPFGHAADKRRDASAPKTKPAAAVTPGSGFEAFQSIVERNIFNPNRSGRTRAVQEDKPPRLDEISLVGTMDYDKGLVAFFHSPDSAFQKTVREGESIGDFKVQRITSAGVELTRGENKVALQVSQQLQRAEGGDWVVASTPPPAAGASGAGTSPTSRSSETVPVEIPADASDVLKRLLKKREKQLN
jgi:hypothetical protein